MGYPILLDAPLQDGRTSPRAPKWLTVGEVVISIGPVTNKGDDIHILAKHASPSLTGVRGLTNIRNDAQCHGIGTNCWRRGEVEHGADTICSWNLHMGSSTFQLESGFCKKANQVCAIGPG